MSVDILQKQTAVNTCQSLGRMKIDREGDAAADCLHLKQLGVPVPGPGAAMIET